MWSTFICHVLSANNTHFISVDKTAAEWRDWYSEDGLCPLVSFICSAPSFSLLSCYFFRDLFIYVYKKDLNVKTYFNCGSSS